MNQSIDRSILPINSSQNYKRRRFLTVVDSLVLWTAIMHIFSDCRTNGMIVRTITQSSKQQHRSLTATKTIPSSIQSWKVQKTSLLSVAPKFCGSIMKGCVVKYDTTHLNTPTTSTTGSLSLGGWRDFGMIHQRKQHIRLFSSSVKDREEIASSSSASASNKKRVVFLGSPPVAAETLQTIYDASQLSGSVFDIVAVISQPPKRGKRGGSVEPTAVGKMAQQLNISTILTPEKANDAIFLQEFIDIRPDLCITAAYGQYLPKKFLDTPTYGTINIHPSLLPKWRGASPMQRSLEAGDNPLGVSVLYTISKMDAGPIITQTTLDVQDHETATTLLPKLFHIGTQSLINILPKVLDGTITTNTATIQNEEEVSYAKLIDTGESEFKVWQESATTCHNRLRGFHMWPKAYMYIKISNHKEEIPFTIKIKVHETRVVSDVRLPPTDIIQTSLPAPTSSSNLSLYVVCFDGSVLELISIQPPSKKPFPSRDLVHGYPNATIQWVQQSETDDNNDDNKSKVSSTETAAATI